MLTPVSIILFRQLNGTVQPLIGSKVPVNASKLCLSLLPSCTTALCCITISSSTFASLTFFFVMLHHMLLQSYVRHIPSSPFIPTDVVLHMSSFNSFPLHTMVQRVPYFTLYVYFSNALRLHYAHRMFFLRSQCLSYIPPQIHFSNLVRVSLVLHDWQHSHSHVARSQNNQDSCQLENHHWYFFLES